MSWGVCVPTWNAGAGWGAWLHTLAPLLKQHPGCVLVIDSMSDDGTADAAVAAGCQVARIDRSTFDHGTTRNLAFQRLEVDVIIFLTQDAILTSHRQLPRLVECFTDPGVGAAYGRQLPLDDATPIASHARLFNYPAVGHYYTRDDIATKGIKAAFLSNSFCAYRVEAMRTIGEFPENTILGEDMLAGLRLLHNDWSLCYQPDATVKHSHNLSLRKEMERYFDIGVLHQESEIIKRLGKAENEGCRFVASEMKYLAITAPLMLPEALLRTAIKYFAYRAGRVHSHLPHRVKIALSSNKNFWKKS